MNEAELVYEAIQAFMRMLCITTASYSSLPFGDNVILLNTGQII